jgi:DNA-binding transcriptional LysR family regulator
MDIRQLRYFIEVAHQLNFTEAAKNLYVAQSAVSQQIASLEHKIGVKLFHRSKRTVDLTTAGSYFLKEAIHIVNKSEQAIETARQIELGNIGKVRIGFLGASVKSFLPQFIRRFHRNYPNIHLDLDQYSLGIIINDAIFNGELDIGLTNNYGLQKINGITYKKVLTEEFSIVMNNEHPLSLRESINLEDLINEPFIIVNKPDSTIYNRVLQFFSNTTFSPTIVNHPPSIETALLLVEAGLGISILPNSFKSFSSPAIRFFDIHEVDTSFDLIAAWREDNINPAAQIFLRQLDHLIDTLEQGIPTD